MSWEMQIFIPDYSKEEIGMKWMSCKCTGANPYTYRWPTKEQAMKSLRDSYSHSLDAEDMRAIEVNKPANIGICNYEIRPSTNSSL